MNTLCDDCKNKQTCDSYKNGNLVAYCENKITYNWIPTSEKPLPKDTEVLATTIWGDVTIADRWNENECFIHEGNSNADIDEIIAWCPLPKPYVEKEELERMIYEIHNL